MIKFFLMDYWLNVECDAPCISSEWLAQGLKAESDEFYHVRISMWHSNIYLKTRSTSHPPFVTEECRGVVARHTHAMDAVLRGSQ